jgi:hypothetical protein
MKTQMQDRCHKKSLPTAYSAFKVPIRRSCQSRGLLYLFLYSGLSISRKFLVSGCGIIVKNDNAKVDSIYILFYIILFPQNLDRNLTRNLEQVNDSPHYSVFSLKRYQLE